MTTRPFEMDLVSEQKSSSDAHNRRQEARVEDCHDCEFEICESGAGGTSIQGHVFTLNRSAHGILLMMGEAPRLDQVIEVYNAKLGWRRSMMVYHVRWTRSVHIQSQGTLFLVGCRLTVGLSATGQMNRSSCPTGSV